VLKALQKKGFKPIHQRGSHIYTSNGSKLVTVPRHSELKLGTLMQIIKDAGLSKDEFIELL
jgi:predicted RNA binding protein YcfA (HicA-like mRNA interferase family)